MGLFKKVKKSLRKAVKRSTHPKEWIKPYKSLVKGLNRGFKRNALKYVYGVRRHASSDSVSSLTSLDSIPYNGRSVSQLMKGG